MKASLQWYKQIVGYLVIDVEAWGGRDDQGAQ